MNVVTWAAGAEEFEQKARLLMTEMRMAVERVEDPEPVRLRLIHGCLVDSLAEMVQRAAANPEAILYGTFHTWRNA